MRNKHFRTILIDFYFLYQLEIALNLTQNTAEALAQVSTPIACFQCSIAGHGFPACFLICKRCNKIVLNTNEHWEPSMFTSMARTTWIPQLEPSLVTAYVTACVCPYMLTHVRNASLVTPGPSSFLRAVQNITEAEFLDILSSLVSLESDLLVLMPDLDNSIIGVEDKLLDFQTIIYNWLQFISQPYRPAQNS